MYEIYRLPSFSFNPPSFSFDALTFKRGAIVFWLRLIYYFADVLYYTFLKQPAILKLYIGGLSIPGKNICLKGEFFFIFLYIRIPK